MVRDFVRGIGDEARAQSLELLGRLPDAAVACVGGGSNAIGLFAAFVPDTDVRLYGIEAGGDGYETGPHAATLTPGPIGLPHGARPSPFPGQRRPTIQSHPLSARLH